MERWSIGEVARRAGIRPSAIRYDESDGNLPPRRANGRRRCAPTVLDRLAVVRMAQAAGFTIAEIKTLVAGFAEETAASTRWRTLTQRKIAEIARVKVGRHVLDQRLRCDCATLDDRAWIGWSCPTDEPS